MLKVMRRYNKVIMVVGGTLLMIAFLMPQAIQRLGQAKLGKSVGAMDGRKITFAQYDRALRESRSIQAFFSYSGWRFPIPLDERRDVEHWLLLTTEAERAGLVGGAEEGSELLPILAQEFVTQRYYFRYRQNAPMIMNMVGDQVEKEIAEEQQLLAHARAKAAGEGRFTPEEFDLALARYRGINRLIDLYLGAERLSDRQTIELADTLADTVIVDGAFLDARRLADPTGEPTPEQLAEQFQRFRSLQPGGSEFGIGYLLPARAKVEYIELDRAAMRDAVKVSMIDANKHHQQNRDKFPGTFDAEREAVEDALRDAEVGGIMDTAESVIRSAVLTAVRPLPQDGNYRVLPADWSSRKPDFMVLAEQVVAAVKERHAIDIPLPGVFLKDASWLDATRLQQLPGIGSASVTFEKQRLTFWQAVLAVRELAGDLPLGLQVGVPAADLPATGSTGSKYYFTVLGAAPEAAPETIDDLLDPSVVAADWRAVQHYQALAAATEQIAATVVAEGLEGYAKSFGEMPAPEVPEGMTAPSPTDKVQIQRAASVTEGGTTLQNLQQAVEVVSAIRARGKTIDPLTPIDQVPLADRVLVLPVPARLGVLVAQINGVQPLTRERLAGYADYARRVHQQRFTQSVGMPQPYQYAVLEARHGFSIKQPSDEQAGEDEQSPEDAEQPSEPAPEPSPG